jgi:hypothetical protein
LGAGSLLKIEEIPVTAPKFLPARNLTYHSVDLFWTEYKGSDFDLYEIHYSKYYGENYKLYLIIKNVKICNLPITGLEEHQLYCFFIRVVDKKGNHIDSEIIYLTTFSTTPSPIAYINGVTYGGNIYSINWEGYKDTNVLAFSRYETFLSTEQYFTPSKQNLLDTIPWIGYHHRDIDMTRLEKNTTYYFKVRTFNIFEKYAESAYLEFKTP